MPGRLRVWVDGFRPALDSGVLDGEATSVATFLGSIGGLLTDRSVSLPKAVGPVTADAGAANRMQRRPGPGGPPGRPQSLLAHGAQERDQGRSSRRSSAIT